MAMGGNTGTVPQLPYHFIPPTIPTLHTHHIPSTPHRSRLYVATFLAQCVRVPLEGKRSNKGLQAKNPYGAAYIDATAKAEDIALVTGRRNKFKEVGLNSQPLTYDSLKKFLKDFTMCSNTAARLINGPTTKI